MDYWIAIDKKKIGPMSLSDVRDRRLSPNTLVWHNGLPTWQRASELPELEGSLAEGAPELPELEREEAPIYVMPVVPATPSAALHPDNKPKVIPPQPPTYLGWSIAAILLCCMPFAIVALVYALKVSSNYRSGDFAAAQKASERAEIWLILSIVVGLVWLPFSIVLGII